MAAPRVAVVGGGIAGSLCALVLRSRGVEPVVFDLGRRSVGGRFGQLRKKRGKGDEGVQFICAPADENSQFGQVLRLLVQHGLVAQWRGRFGLLGSHGGGFLPKDIISSTVLDGMQKEGDQQTSSTIDGDDFCGFIRTGPKASELLVGVPSMSSICHGICSIAKLQVHPAVQITDAQLDSARLWNLLSADAGERACLSGFQAVAIASHDPSLAAKVVRHLADETRWQINATDGEQRAELESIVPRLMNLSGDLQTLRDQSVAPVFTLSAAFAEGTLSRKVPFDAVSCPNSPHFQFIVREGSKPGRAEQQNAGEELWSAVSTTSYARELVRIQPDRDAAAKTMSDQLLQILRPYHEEGALPAPIWSSARLWKTGFATRTLGLQEDCVGLEPWRLAICGDYLRNHSTPVEAAALSGMEAGERIASWLSGRA